MEREDGKDGGNEDDNDDDRDWKTEHRARNETRGLDPPDLSERVCFILLLEVLALPPAPRACRSSSYTGASSLDRVRWFPHHMPKQLGPAFVMMMTIATRYALVR